MGLAYIKAENGGLSPMTPQIGDLVEYDAVANNDGGITVTAMRIITQGPDSQVGPALARCG
ncbi:MAG: hypothetical protein DI498_14225 [Paracoccus denitrificans]|nr:MAG: hypothetical protein DI498_14225 [Paracoccus denitrificans]PZO82785.1 MAG: hypothetical protein DI633_14225 [Paracoccus denitrificans]